jgi:hypothetical protein
MPVRDRSLPQATARRERTRPKLLAAGAFLLAVLAAVMPGSDRAALAQTANINILTSANNPIPLNGLYDSGVTLVYAIGTTAAPIAISDYKPLKIGLTVEVDSELMTITDLTPGSPATMTVDRPNPVSHAANKHVWANAAPVEVFLSDVGERETGAKLAAGINSNLFEPSGATLTQAVDAAQKDLTVSDWSVLYTGRTAMAGSEKMYINSVDAGFWGKTGATLAGCAANDPVDPVPPCVNYNTIPISDQSKLGVGWTVQVDSEKMLISALYDGSPDTMTVQRGYDGSTITYHHSGAIIHRVRATLAGDVAYQTVIPISNKTLLVVGQTVRVGLELMHIEALSGGPPYTMTVERGYASSSIQEHASGETIFIDSDSGATLAGLGIIDDQVTTIPISDKDLVAVGQTVRVDFELMQITALHEGSPDTMDVIRGRPPSSASSHFSSAVIFKQQNSNDTLAAHVESDVTVIPISSKDLLQVGWVALVDDEKMYIEALSGTSPPYTMTVVRGYDNTDVTTHDSGQAVYSGPDRINVQRGYGETTPAAHSAYTPIYEDLRTLTVDDRSALKKDSTIRVGSEYMSIAELPEEENTIKVSRGERGSTPASHSTGDHILDADGLGGYSFTVTTDSVSAYLQPVYARDGDPQGNTFVGSIEIGTTECSNAVDDDGDWKVNDGCPTVNTFPETGAKCNNAIDDDSDGKINDGCPGRTLYSPSLQVEGNSLQFSQTTTGTEPGSTGSGTLATFTLWAKQFTATPLNLCALVSVTLMDVSANVIPSAPQSCQVKIVKCPDVTFSRDVNIADVLEIARVVYDFPGFLCEPRHDINNNGTCTVADLLIAARFAFLGPKLHCPLP